MTGYIVAFAGFAAILWLGNGIRRIGAVSRGEPIGQRSGRALILIDLQTAFWDRGPYGEAEKATALSAILTEIAAAKAEGTPIIAVRQEWSIPSTKAIARLAMKGLGVEGTAGTELAAPFAALPDHVLVKRVQDAFETGDLDRILEKLDIGKLRLVGLDLAYCVAKTALGARQRGYEAEIVAAGTLSASQTPAARARLRLEQAGVALR